MHVCVSEFFLLLPHHDSSDADAYVTNDVEFTVEEVLNSCHTVLQRTDKSS